MIILNDFITMSPAGKRKAIFLASLFLISTFLVVGWPGLRRVRAVPFQSSDVGIIKSAPATVAPDANLTYTITVVNNGPDDAPGASWTDPLPVGTTFVSVSSVTGWTCSDPGVGNNGTVTCSNSSFPLESDTFNLVVHVTAAGGTNLVNQVTISSQNPDNNDENNASSAGTLVLGGTSADVGITKTGPSQTLADKDVNYSIMVTNFGPNAASNVTLYDVVPGGMVFVSFTQNSGPIWSCTGNNTPCTIASLPVNSTSVFTLVGHVPPSTLAGTEYTNQASITSDNDPNSENDSSSAATQVVDCSSPQFFFNPIVTTNADSGAGSLRQAISDACVGSTITFDMSQFSSPITLTTTELAINKNLTISGPGANTLTVQRSTANAIPTFRVFDVQSGTVAISDLTISNGDFGGLFNGGTLNLTNVTVSGNSVISSSLPPFGGGILNAGTLVLTNSTVSGNSASGPGGIAGGLANTGTMTLSNSTVSGNNATREGGGINSGGTLTLNNSTITNNRSDSDNSGGEQGGGIFRAGGTITLRNTIVSGNFRGTGATRDDVSGALDATSSFNLIGDGTNMTGITNGSNGNQVGSAGSPINALLAALANYGGPTQTQALLPGSPAIDAGSNTIANNAGLTTDQRGFSRIVDTTVDIGAFESSGFLLTATSGTPQNATIGSAFTSPLIASITGFDGEPVNGGIIMFTAPGSGPSATLTGGNTTAAVTIGGGQASTNASANGLAGPYSVNATAAGSTSASFNLTNNKGNTITAVTSSKNPSFLGQPVTFTATVSAVAAPSTATGTVTFLDAGNPIGTAPLGGGVATFTTSTLAVGNHTITTSYNGDGNFNGSTGSLSGNPQVVNNPNTTTTITSSVNPSDLGQPVTFTALISAVQSSAGTPTGTVQFKDNGNNLGVPVTLNGGGMAQFTTSSLTIGNHGITANYSGDSNFLLSSSSLAGGQTVLFRPLIKFSQPTYSVNENGSFITITVVRSGDTNPAVTVDYSTPDDSAALTFLPCSNANGVASPRCDFTTALGTLKFGPGETSKTFTVLISQDTWVEGNETVALTLSNPTGGAAFQQPSDANAVLTIVDDDLTPPTTNAIDDSNNFVRQHYHDFLSREPDAPGFSFWTNQIESCGADAQCRAARRVNVSSAFFRSIEFQNTGYFVERMYKAGFGDINPPTVPVPVRFTSFVRDSQEVRGDIIVGAGNWQAQLEANKLAFALEFVQRAAFLNRYPALTSATAFVDSLNANAGLVLSDTERSALIAELSPSPSDPALRADVLQKVAENQTLQQRESNRAFVLMEYFGYLRRNPDAAPESGLNFNGYNFWVNKLNQFNGDFIGSELIKAFITASEYRARFGP